MRRINDAQYALLRANLDHLLPWHQNAGTGNDSIYDRDTVPSRRQGLDLFSKLFQNLLMREREVES
jgi:hypothetical protein